MSEAIDLTFGFERRTFRRALMAFWFSAVPRASFRWRIIFWTISWLAIGLVVMLGWSAKVPWALIWLAVLLGFGVVILILQRTRMARFYDALAEHWARTGDMTARFDPDGMRVTQKGVEMRFDWSAVDAVVKIRGGTVFRIGMTMLSVPDRVLPDSMTGAAFRAQVGLWREA